MKIGGRFFQKTVNGLGKGAQGTLLLMEKWREHVTVNPLVCHGKACIRGTRIMVSEILDNLAAGIDRAEMLASYPALKPSDIDTALGYAAELAREGTMDLPLELSA